MSAERSSGSAPMTSEREGVPTVADDHRHLAEAAQQATDRLAFALEEVGFDVGTAFPDLRSGWASSGASGVRLGAVTCEVADDLAALLVNAVEAGVTLPPD
jgi:hypothetical protein